LDYVTCAPSTEYQVSLNNADYSLLIRELSSDKSFICSHNLTNGRIFKTSPGSLFLAITLFNISSRDSVAINFEALFDSGFKASINSRP
jgi:hypothetical protein